MRIIVPDYYKDFRCLAGDCRHSCCIGWEIDIDRETLNYYQSVEGEFGDRLRKNINTDGETPCFRMAENDRCPFLNEKGLCEVMINLGPDKVSPICDDHPRFRNFYSDRTEIGLGLSCEAVADMILSRQDKTQFVCIEDGEEVLWTDEWDFIDLRDRIFEILQDRKRTVQDRILGMLQLCDTIFPKKTAAEWADIFMSLEKLDDERDIYLNLLKNAEESELCLPEDEKIQIALEQLAVYFVFRHMTDSLDDGLLAERAAFAALSIRIISWIFAVIYNSRGNITHEEMVEICCIYSTEIEYNPDNVQALLDVLKKE